MLSFKEAIKDMSGTFFLLGVDGNNQVVSVDLSKISHLLIAGATGTGKSVLLHDILLSLLKNNSESALQVALFDSQVIEFARYARITANFKVWVGGSIPTPIVLEGCPVVTDKADIGTIMSGLFGEMEHRLAFFVDMAKKQQRMDYSCESFLNEHKLHRILILIDDLTSFLVECPDISYVNKEGTLTGPPKLSKKLSPVDAVRKILLNGHTVGIHLIAATPTPTWKNTKAISALFRSKVVFPTATSAELKFLFGSNQSEPLARFGEALYSCNGETPLKIRTLLPSEEDFDAVLSLRKSEN